MDKIYCKDCIFYRNIYQFWHIRKDKTTINLCVHPNEYEDTPISPKGDFKWTDCLIKNKDYNCSNYQKIEEEKKEVVKEECDVVLKFIRSLKW